MEVSAYVHALQEDLGRIAAVGDESTARTAEVLSVALESSLARRMQDALTEAALELSTQLDGGRIEGRGSCGGAELGYVEDAAPAASAPDADEALAARVTLRLPESLKSRIEA